MYHIVIVLALLIIVSLFSPRDDELGQQEVQSHWKAAVSLLTGAAWLRLRRRFPLSPVDRFCFRVIY